MIQDLVTKSVVPVFNIEKLPQFYTEDESAIKISYSDKSIKKPRSASQKTAMRYWAKLCQNKCQGLVGLANTIDVSESPHKNMDIENYIPFEDEVDWESAYSSEKDMKSEIKTLAEKEDEILQQKHENDLKNLTIIDDSPEFYWARGYIAINRNAPDEVIIVSPFGEALDDWFRNVINRLRACDSNFEDELQLFLMEKKDELKDTLAFGNDLDIALFNEFPFVCNNTKYKVVKRAIKELTVSKKRIDNGEDDTIGFARSLRTAYEASLRVVVRDNSYLLEGTKISLDQYNQKLHMLAKTYPFVCDDIEKVYRNKDIYFNMTHASGEKGHVKAYISLLLMDAWNNKDGKSMDLLRNIPSFPIDIIRLEGNDASHGGDRMADLFISESKANKQYSEFETFFRAIFNRFMEDK